MGKIARQSILALVVALAFSGPAVSAQEIAPDALLNAVTLEVLASAKKDRETKACNPAKVAELIETRILPHFDLARMAQSAVARNWRLATPEQQKTMIAEFKTLLVRTYAAALTNYRDQVIEFKRVRVATGETDVTVKSIMKHQGAEPLTIEYDMEKQPAGWKVYDIKIAGVSLVTSYRETFAGAVRIGGIDGLIRSLADTNRQTDWRLNPYQPENFPLMFAIVQTFLQAMR